MPANSSNSVLSNRALNIKDSITMAITAKANQMKANGESVLSFSAGEPDFNTPDPINQAAKHAIDQAKTRYTPAAGIIELRQAICQKLLHDQGLQYDDSQIVVSCGAKHSIYNALLSIINEGDEVIIPAPYWVSYPDQVELVGGVPVIIETHDTEHFKITPEKLRSALSSKSKCVIINSPSNPTGAVYTKEELNALKEVIETNDLLVISDEIYEKLIYGSHTHTSIAELSSTMQERTLLINGVSKSYAMTGWRIGYTAAPSEIAKAMGKIQSQTTSNPSSIAQWAALEAINGSQDTVTDMQCEFEKRRKIMSDGLNAIDGVTCLLPIGAFYAFPNVSSHYQKEYKGSKIKGSADFCKALLDSEKVACVPGGGFGADKHIRLSYAASMEDILEGLERIRTFVSRLG